MREGIHRASHAPNEQQTLVIKSCTESGSPQMKGDAQKQESAATLNMYLDSYLHTLGYCCAKRKRGRWLV
jgi:hypothetical protein